MSRISCALTTNFATAAVLSDTALIWPWNTHMSGCLRCQAHVASVKATRRRLGEMRTESVSAPVGFEPSAALMLDPTSIATESKLGAGRHLAAVSAGVAAAALAAAWIWRRTQAKSA